MNKAITLLFTLAVLAACQSRDSRSYETTKIPFEDFLGRPVNDIFLIGFFAENNCIPEGPFYVCRSIGLAVWFDADQLLQTVYFYVTAPDGFEPYEGELPYGLKFYDTLGAVEYKLKLLSEDGRPRSDLEVDLTHTGSTPDRLHYWVDYERYGIAVIYNAPFADEDATLYAVLLKNENMN